jgi:hypothetical protein
MSSPARFSLCLVVLTFTLAFSMSSFGQTPSSDDPEAAAAISNASPGYPNISPVGLDLSQPIQLTIGANTVLDSATGAVVGAAAGQGSASKSAGGFNNSGDTDLGIADTRPNVPTIAGLDTVATFDGAFFAQAGPNSAGLRLFRFTMMGNDPHGGDTTLIPAPIDEVSLTLLNADGSVFKNVPFAPFEDLTLDSPNFEEHDYRSGVGLQYADAIHRAQFFNVMGKDWHTTLRPRIVNRVTLTVPRFVNVRLANGTVIQARSYFTGTAKDGSTFVLMLNLLFNNFFFNVVVNDIVAGNFTTRGLNMTLFPNTYLFSLNVNNPNVPGGCCVLGFHTFFFEPGTVPQPRWVTQYASWISPGLFGGGFQDVTALSHETSEAFGDPFLDNVTPVWQFPGVPANAKVCQGNLEEGDPIEVLATASVPIKLKERNQVFTYHPQNIPLLQWFEMGATSNAIDGAFSFPDETALPHSALPCPQ